VILSFPGVSFFLQEERFSNLSCSVNNDNNPFYVHGAFWFTNIFPFSISFEFHCIEGSVTYLKYYQTGSHRTKELAQTDTVGKQTTT
jgi:hypothetical protein